MKEHPGRLFSDSGSLNSDASIEDGVFRETFSDEENFIASASGAY